MTDSIEFNNFLTEIDVYRTPKTELQEILTKFNIKFKESDLVVQLREIVADLKAFLKNPTEEKKYILKKLTSQRHLTETELDKYQSLTRIYNFIAERDNLYDTVADVNSANEDYEEINFGNNLPQKSSTNADQINQFNLVEPTTAGVTLTMNPAMATVKEKIPLISAGTYHGLPTENPSDFIDKYEIAATSNHWAEQTKINLFAAHLAGTALAWFQHYSTGNQINRWEELKNIFISTFTPAAQAQTLKAILDRKVQGKDQPVLSYYLEIMKLCKRHDPATTEKQIIQYVIQGLRPEYCERILNETCETLNQLENGLRKIELQIKLRELNREKCMRAENVSTNNTDASKDELNSIKTEIKNLTQMVSNLNIQQNQSRNYNNTQGQHKRYSGNSHSSGYYNGQRNLGQNYQDPNYRRGSHQPNYRGTWNQPGQQGTTQLGNRHGYNSSNRNTFQPHQRTPQRNAQLYCNYCKRNNHNIQDCRARRPTQTGGTVNQGKSYCTHCKMTNHNTENCFKKNKPGNNQKNE
jgi:uncharacterized protein YoxC